jgi:ATP-binding cassette subfamily G (WHITE) protein 2 (PDR)
VLNFHLQDPEAPPMRTAGVAFRNLNVFGFGTATDYQKSVGNVLLESVSLVRQALGLAKQRRIDILRGFEGVVYAGEMLVVLGPPGSGCSTLLKTISGETDGLNIDHESYLNYQGELKSFSVRLHDRLIPLLNVRNQRKANAQGLPRRGPTLPKSMFTSPN